VHPYRLIVSLTSARPDRRRRLIPVAGQVPIGELADAIRERAAVTGERVTIAWVLIGGENTGDDEIEALRELLADVPIRINLIDVNDARDDGYRRAGDDERNRFVDALAALHIPFQRRYSGGAERHAACGMLAAQRCADGPSQD
jgi:23S rRNA (adenine2503-C2)-methyltransferase